jgi:predicted dithiol-disulfide oxidoreductase (DUF899 family)
MTKKNTGHLLSIYCPACQKVTDKISFNLLREAGKVSVSCHQCLRVTYIEYNGKIAHLYHQDDALYQVLDDMTPKGRKELKAFVKDRKK